jgi:hypothetical protein
MKLTQNALIQWLQGQNLQPTHQAQSDQIFIVMKIASHEVPVFLAMRSKETLLQLIAYIPYDLPAKSVPEISRLLHLINREVDMPGFGLDEQQKLMFYRLVIPSVDGEIEEKTLTLYLNTITVALETFMAAIAIVASGNATVDSLTKQKKIIEP